MNDHYILRGKTPQPCAINASVNERWLSLNVEARRTDICAL